MHTRQGFAALGPAVAGHQGRPMRVTVCVCVCARALARCVRLLCTRCRFMGERKGSKRRGVGGYAFSLACNALPPPSRRVCTRRRRRESRLGRGPAPVP